MSGERANRFGVLGRLPHRYPFLMVDRIVSIQPGECIEGVIVVGARERTDWSLTPLLLCESLAQLSKALEVAEDPQFESISFLAGMQVQFSFDQPLEHDVRLLVRRQKSFSSMVSYGVEASSGGRTLLEGVIRRRTNAT